uniref:Molybdopterin synthase sulfur carrier subunit n=1 Tax=Strongyloides papillosus TaxID=174720 RepID=A0A0N5BAF5_STREA
MLEKNVLLFGSAREPYDNVIKIVFPKVVKGKIIKDIIFRDLDKISHLKDCCMLAINQEYVKDFDVEIDMDNVKEIAVLPPLSGG